MNSNAVDILVIPEDYNNAGPVCQTVDEVLKSKQLRYVFILALKKLEESSENIRDGVETLQKLVTGERNIDTQKLLNLLQILKNPNLIEQCLNFFNTLQFSQFDGEARERYGALFSFQAKYHNDTSQKYLNQLLSLLYRALPEDQLKKIPDTEIYHNATRLIGQNDYF